MLVVLMAPSVPWLVLSGFCASNLLLLSAWLVPLRWRWWRWPRIVLLARFSRTLKVSHALLRGLRRLLPYRLLSHWLLWGLRLLYLVPLRLIAELWLKAALASLWCCLLGLLRLTWRLRLARLLTNCTLSVTRLRLGRLGLTWRLSAQHCLLPWRLGRAHLLRWPRPLLWLALARRLNRRSFLLHRFLLSWRRWRRSKILQFLFLVILIIIKTKRIACF